jgi:hypothetical protein
MELSLEMKPGFRNHLSISLAGFGGLGILLSLYTLGTSYYSVSGYGDWTLPTNELVVWLCLLAMVVMAVSVGGLFIPKLRYAALAVFIGTGLLVTLCIASLKSADSIRIQGFERLTHEAAPLVEAIHAYHEKYGLPPKAIEDLQVAFPSGHTIKGDELPEFKYLQGEQASERFHGNPWVLILETPTGPLKWDRFVYYPLQNYPPLASGGWFEKVGTWGYLHE